MRELLLHATVYQARLGDPRAADVARSLASQVDNSLLPRVLDVSVAAAPIP
jgi:hypothetical protein